MKKIAYFCFIVLSFIILSSCQKEMVTITFNALYVESPDAIIVESGKPFELPAPEIRIGYTFDGWYQDEDYIIEARNYYRYDVILYAKWTANTYTLTFDSDGGNDIDSISYQFGEKLQLPIPEKEKYQFIGWYVLNDWDQLITDDTNLFFENSTLVASWEMDHEAMLLSTIMDILDASSISMFHSNQSLDQSNIYFYNHVAKDGDQYYSVFQQITSPTFVNNYYYNHETKERYFSPSHIVDLYFDMSQISEVDFGYSMYQMMIKLIDRNMDISMFDYKQDSFVLKNQYRLYFQQTYTKYTSSELVIGNVTYQVHEGMLYITIENFDMMGTISEFMYEDINDTHFMLPDHIYELDGHQGINQNHMKLGYLHQGTIDSTYVLESLLRYVNDINDQGGINGMTFEIVSYSYMSNRNLFIEYLSELLFKDQVYGLLLLDYDDYYADFLSLHGLVPNIPIFGLMNATYFQEMTPYMTSIYPMRQNHLEETRSLLHYAYQSDYYGESFNQGFGSSDVIGILTDETYHLGGIWAYRDAISLNIDEQVAMMSIDTRTPNYLDLLVNQIRNEALTSLVISTKHTVILDILDRLEIEGIHIPVFLTSEASRYDRTDLTLMSYPVYSIHSYMIYDNLGEETDAYQLFKSVMGLENINLYTKDTILAYQIYEPIFTRILSELNGNYDYDFLHQYISEHTINQPFGGFINYQDDLREVAFALFKIEDDYLIRLTDYESYESLKIRSK